MEELIRLILLLVVVQNAQYIYSSVALAADDKTRLEAVPTEAPQANVPEKGKTQTLNFDADTIEGSKMEFQGDIIEGNRKTPSVFLELGSREVSLESLIFRRTNFNDYQEVENTKQKIKPQ